MVGTRVKGAGTRVALVVATSLATVAIMGGGPAGALMDVADDSVNSSKIVDNTIRSRDIRNGTIKLSDLSDEVASQLGVPGPAGPVGPVGPVGPAGGVLPLQLQTVEQNATGAGTDSITAVANCPAGFRVVSGGGLEVDTQERAFLVDSHPTANGTGWRARYRADDGDLLFADSIVAAFAICTP